jgi:phosphoenolpyruvate carboxylase
MTLDGVYRLVRGLPVFDSGRGKRPWVSLRMAVAAAVETLRYTDRQSLFGKDRLHCPRIPSLSREAAQKRMAERTPPIPAKSEAQTKPAASAAPIKKSKKAKR